MNGTEMTAWRAERGWSKYRLARELGVQQSTILRWENGKHPIPKAVHLALERLACAARRPPAEG